MVELSEQDFYLLNGNSYRGSRYANFVGSGVDPQGNVSSAINENAVNIGKGTSVDPSQSVQPSIDSGSAASKGLVRQANAANAPAPMTMGKAATNMALGAAVPFATSSLGSGVGAAAASGLSTSDGMRLGVNAAKERISSGLLGGTSGLGAGATATNAALGSMGGKFGPATSGSVSKAAAGAGIGGAVGTGFGSAISTLLAGGSPKSAAASGIGSGIGYAVGNMILPGIGGWIGSTLGSTVFGKMFGGSKPPRVTLGLQMYPDEQGRYKTTKVSTKGSSNETASKYADQISGILNSFKDATGIKFKTGVGIETNIGKKDQGTTYLNTNQRISEKPGDAGAAAFAVLRDRRNYDLGPDSAYNDFFQKALAESSSISDLGGRLDSYGASRGLISTPEMKRGTDRKTSFYS